MTQTMDHALRCRLPKPSVQSLLKAAATARAALADFLPVPGPRLWPKLTATLCVRDTIPSCPVLRQASVQYIIADPRGAHIRIVGLSVITRAAIRWMADVAGQRNAFKVGAGSGLISAELQLLNVTATDLRPPGHNRYDCAQALCTIAELDAATAIATIPASVLIRSWPEMEAYAHQARDAFPRSPVG